MKTITRADWVAALRSGDYKQTKGVLRSHDEINGASYCCLGVACAVAELPLTPDMQTWDITPDRLFAVEENLYFGESLLPEVIEQMLLVDDVLQSALAGMNDGGGDKTFEQIADYIETLPDNA